MSNQVTQEPLRDLVRRARKEQGLTQVELAEAVEMSQRWVSDLEAGTIDLPRPATLRRMADVLNVPLADLYIAGEVARTRAEANRIVTAHDEGRIGANEQATIRQMPATLTAAAAWRALAASLTPTQLRLLLAAAEAMGGRAELEDVTREALEGAGEPEDEAEDAFEDDVSTGAG